jgi:hypothetical protein
MSLSLSIEYTACAPHVWGHRATLAKELAAKPWGDKSRRYFLTREEEYVGGLEAAVGIW